jgi:phosphoribosylanthranilate isomerase
MKKIKICGIKDHRNIIFLTRYIIPDYIGLNYYNLSPRYVTNKIIINKTITLKVGVFVNSFEQYIFNIVKNYDLDFVQLHGNESLRTCSILNSSGIKIIKTFNIDNNFLFNKIVNYTAFCGFFLFDSYTHLLGGSGNKFIWEKIYEYNLNVPFFLSGGINYNDIDFICNLHHPKLFGIDLNSKFEICTVIKNINKLQKFLYELSK